MYSRTEIINTMRCRELMDNRVFIGNLHDKQFIVLIMEGEREFPDKTAFSTSNECPELRDTKSHVMVWWRGECKGLFKRTDKMYEENGFFKYPMAMVLKWKK